MQGSGPKGVDGLCFYTYGKFSPSAPLLNWGRGWPNLAEFYRNRQNLAEFCRAKFGRIWQHFAEISRILQKSAEFCRNQQNFAELGRIWQNLSGGTKKKEGEEGENSPYL